MTASKEVTTSDYVRALKLAESVTQLYTSGKHPTPRFLSQLERFKVLWSWEARGSGIQEWPCQISRLPLLRHLDFADNQIAELPVGCNYDLHLGSLILGGNRFTEFPNPVCKMLALNRLDLSGNQITALPETLADLEDLRAVNFGENPFAADSFDWSKLSKLEELWLNGMTRAQGDCRLRLPSSLRRLFFGRNGILAWTGALPKNISLIDLALNELQEFPSALKSLQWLQFLDLSNNQIKEIPQWIGTLKRLESLNLSRNPIDRIPETLRQCIFLQSLSLEEAELKTFPLEILGMERLQKLELEFRDGDSVPQDLHRLKSLEVLAMSAIDSPLRLPQCFFEITTLRELRLVASKLQYFPAGLWKLENLTELDLSYNPISDLPMDWSGLPNLSSLQIFGFPDDVIQSMRETNPGLWVNHQPPLAN